MSENTTSHVQQNMDAWKKIVDKQVEIAGSISDEAARLRKLGAEKTVENVEEMGRVAKESAEHVREMIDPEEHFTAWKGLMDRQFEVANGFTKSVGEMQTSGFEKTRATIKTWTDLSDTTLKHAIDLNEAWNDAAMETAKRAMGWMPTSF